MLPLLSLVFSAMLAPGAPFFDLVPPGHRPVRHEMIVQRGGVPEGMRLVAAPFRGFGGVHQVVAGEAFRFSSKYGTRLYLLPADGTALPEWERGWVEQHAHTGTFREVASAPLGSPLARVLTTWRFTGVDDKAIRLEIVSEQRFDGGGNPLPMGVEWFAILTVGVIGAGWLWWLDRQRTAAARAEQVTAQA